ncbi:DUF805 domain-containing protein [Thiobacillus sedimenti]|uniref:DUF805 domain-containing protein n=1 Tax=Thiobacillus sedimenti TaxID=3110231 RepID=A0ABZ1CJW4_9PROT|nr:DUF805 domain-containing protein [Thiobacillus sp. SCUT-2]WRS39675.1 DUF805 domain-containing protein [Thiobacillus sp. SCUT-2]
MDWYLMAWQKYFDFSGRSRRKEYWMFFLFNLGIGIALLVADLLTGSYSKTAGMGLLGGLYSLATLIPNLSMTVRRLHDIGRSGWWFFILLVPLIGAIVLLVFMLLDSKEGANDYGPNPKLITP